MDATTVFSLDADINLNQISKFDKLTLNEKKRLFLAVMDERNQPKLTMCQYFYNPATRAQFQVPSNPELAKLCVAKFGTPKIKFATIIGVIPTDKFANISQPFNPENISLQVWLFSTDKYAPLKTLNSEWQLSKIDFIVECTETNFQKFNFVPCRDRVIDQTPDIAEKLKEQALESFNAVSKYLPKQLSDQEVMAQLNGTVVQAPQAINPFTPAPAAVPQIAQQVSQNPFIQSPAQFQTPATVPQAQGGSEFANFATNTGVTVVK